MLRWTGRWRMGHPPLPAPVRGLEALEELTWPGRRSPGLEELHREIERSERTGDPLSVALLRVEGTVDVLEELRTELRAYDIVVVMGGHEYMCILADADERAVRGRFAGIVARIERRSRGGIVRAGFAEFEPGESGEALIQRADAELLAQRP